MKLEKRKQFIVNFLYFAIIICIIILLTRYALGALMPFFIAFLIALLLKPAVSFFHDKLKLPRGLVSVFFVIVLYALLGLLLIVIGVQLFSAAKSFFMTLPTLYTDSIVPWVSSAFLKLQQFSGQLNPEAAAAYDVVSANVTTSLGDAVVNISKQVVTWATNFTLKTPGFLLKLLITVIATIFLTVDFPKIHDFVMRQLPERLRLLLHNARVQLGRTLWSYLRSYAIIMSITFGEIFLGLSIIGVKNAAGIAVAIAIFDILPVVGSGLVLLPWTIYSIVSGNLTMGIGLGILYVVVIIVRQIVEPKIVGDRVGLHPLVTLISMVLGTYLFGGIGLLGLPITVALIHALNKEGAIHLYKLTGSDSSAKTAQEPLAPATAEVETQTPAESPAPKEKAREQKNSK